jgi:threonine/homoserine/homoserine lactone efflux protein
VIVLSLLLTLSISQRGKLMNKVSQAEKVVRIGASLIFIAIGIYYIAKVNLGL